jgi:hypothetical protein
MRFKSFTVVTMIAVLVGVAQAGVQSRSAAAIKVVINNAPAKDGVTPLEIIQPAVVSTARNKLDDFSYILRNNSDKAVKAVAVVETINYEDGGKTYADSFYSTMDTAFHKDFAAKPLLPGNQMTIGSPGPSSFNEGVVIKEITLSLAYALYDDQTAYGEGGKGERLIKEVREGAQRYKNWLAEQYSRAGNSLATILSTIQASGIPEALKLDSDQTMGAERYRLSLLRTFRTKGAADVESHLKQNQ